MAVFPDPVTYSVVKINFTNSKAITWKDGFLTYYSRACMSIVCLGMYAVLQV